MRQVLPLITPRLLMAVGASAERAGLYAPLLDAFRVVPGDSFQTITSQNGIAMLVAQLAHESAGFSRTSESLNYSVEALRTGPLSRWFTPQQAQAYGRVTDSAGRVMQPANQRMIAYLAYGRRLGNRGPETEDGWVFRGAGLIQLTGRDNHTRFGRSISKTPEEAAEYCRTPEGAVASSFWFWRSMGLLVPASRGDVEACTKIINGGYIGLTERKALFHSALDSLG